MKQTAVEWLFEQVWITSGEDLPELLEQAKEMERQNIIDAHISGMEFIAVDPNHYNNDAEQYYNETFKNK